MDPAFTVAVSETTLPQVTVVAAAPEEVTVRVVTVPGAAPCATVSPAYVPLALL